MNKAENLRRTIINRVKVPACGFKLAAVLSLLFFSCGIDDIPYLPQIDSPYIIGNSANFIIPANFLDTTQQFYATGYRIFYKIYLSGIDEPNPSSLEAVDFILSSSQSINNTLTSDFRFLKPFTDPSNNSRIISNLTFFNQGFFELEPLIPVSTSGQTAIHISFPPDSEPFLTINTELPRILERSKRLETKKPEQFPYFLITNDLVNNALAVRSENADVAKQTPEITGFSNFAYAALYIVVEGINDNFNIFYSSKPTFVNVFQLHNNP